MSRALRRTARRPWLWLMAAAALLSFGLGRMALIDPDEGRYAATALEMVADGDLILPHFNSEPRLNKPPLIYWLQAASFLLLGVGEAAARLPSLLAAVATVALTGWWAMRRVGRGACLMSMAALSTCLIFFACARLAITDMLLALWVTAALLLWHEAYAEPDPAARRRLGMASSLACGLAVLTKGPVGVILPALIILAASALSRTRRMIGARGVGVAIAGVALVVGPWLAGLAGRTGINEILDLLRRESYERAAWGLDHPRPFYYLLLTFWLTFLPWSLALPILLARALGIQGILSGAQRRLDSVTALLLAWVGMVIIFFSLLADKNDAYLLPAAPALALLAALELPHRLIAWIAGAMVPLLLAAVMMASPPISRERSMKEVVMSAGLHRPADYTLVSYRLYRPSLVFYAGRPVRWITSGKELRRLLVEIPPRSAVAILMTERRRQALPAHLASLVSDFDLIGSESGYVVLYRTSEGILSH